MGRILAVDHGTSRTGLAVSDPLGITCSPVEILRERDPERLVEAVIRVAEREGAEVIVVGLPRPLSGGTNEQLSRAEAFAAALAGASPIRVDTWDERFTTKLARRDRGSREAVDSVAACHLLQNYLDSLSARAARDSLAEEGRP